MVRQDQNGSEETDQQAASERQLRTGSQSTRPQPRRSFLARLRRYTPPPLSIDSSESGHQIVTPVIDLDDNSFIDALRECVTIVEFWAPWCGPCRILQPRFDDAARSQADNPRLQFVRVNVDESPEISSAFNVMSIPTLVVFDHTGRETDREVGLPGKRRLNQLARDAGAAADTISERGTP